MIERWATSKANAGILGDHTGAHRPAVTTSALVLRSSGFIKYRRGEITILDRKGLEDFICDCCQIARQD